MLSYHESLLNFRLLLLSIFIVKNDYWLFKDKINTLMICFSNVDISSLDFLENIVLIVDLPPIIFCKSAVSLFCLSCVFILNWSYLSLIEIASIKACKENVFYVYMIILYFNFMIFTFDEIMNNFYWIFSYAFFLII